MTAEPGAEGLGRGDEVPPGLGRLLVVARSMAAEGPCLSGPCSLNGER
jgi:hypothetical protein